MTLQKLRRTLNTWVPYQGGGAEFSSFVVGVTKPVAGNVGIGLVAPTPVNTYDGDILITTAGTTIENLVVNGRILVRAANVTVRNCWVRGGAAVTSGNTALIDCNHSAAFNVLVEYCLLVPRNPSVYVNGMIGHDYTVRRTETFHGVDGFGIYNTSNSNGPARVVIESSWAHDVYYYSPDPNHGDNRTHNDGGVQVQGNSQITLRGSRLECNVSTVAGNGYPGASPAPVASNPYFPSATGQAVGITPNVGAVTSFLMELCWLDYGAQSFTAIPGAFSAAATVGEIRGNRFGRNQPTLTKGGVSAKRAVLVDPNLSFTNMVAATGADTNGNVFEDTGLPVTIYRITA